MLHLHWNVQRQSSENDLSVRHSKRLKRGKGLTVLSEAYSWAVVAKWRISWRELDRLLKYVAASVRWQDFHADTENTSLWIHILQWTKQICSYEIKASVMLPVISDAIEDSIAMFHHRGHCAQHRSVAHQARGQYKVTPTSTENSWITLHVVTSNQIIDCVYLLV